jgi:hypothetical protein
MSRIAKKKVILMVLVAFIAVRESIADCPNGCSGHGLCGTPDRVCLCSVGFMGGDCSLRTCPQGLAWTDQTIKMDDAHNFAECSNMGHCDRSTGLCTCNPGFEGLSCQRMTCPNMCTGHGTCQSMRYHATQKDPGDGQIYLYTENWDADKIYGCQCDEGYAGYDCSLRNCPRGDDPLTGKPETVKDPTELQQNERQKIKCLASGGYFTLTFKKQTTEHINFDDSLSEITVKFNALSTVSNAVISFENAATTMVCTKLGNTMTFEFTQDFGKLPLIVVDNSKLTYFAGAPILENQVTERVVGTKENMFCSGRGTCDPSIGVCTCFEPFSTSDGNGNPGRRGDCGTSGSSSVSACPGDIACSGHGVCQGPNTYNCVCANGWYGGDCAERTCPSGKSWFGLPDEKNDKAHLKTECSNMGVCDRSKGECTCLAGFEGSACQYIACPGGSPPCNGHGSCYDMSQLAELAQVNGDSAGVTYGTIPNLPATWDYNMMRGCLCDQGWEGYDCTLRTCPTGDDPNTEDQFKEKQILICTASSGSFFLTFRGAQTKAISYLANQAQMKAELEKLQTIGVVDVSFSTFKEAEYAQGERGNDAGDVACTPDGQNSISITFVTELGNVPALKVKPDDDDMTIILLTDGKGHSQMGTMENALCNNRGICDISTGSCKCYEGFGSSDGSGGPGTRGDCGYLEPIYAGSGSEGANNA